MILRRKAIKQKILETFHLAKPCPRYSIATVQEASRLEKHAETIPNRKRLRKRR
jgi:hypothetical protein